MLNLMAMGSEPEGAQCLAKPSRMEYQDGFLALYPTGGGEGLIGMWKAFDEMQRLGWIGSHRPRMISVQAEGCAPIVKAFDEGKIVSSRYENAHTFASGLRVPKAYADYLILDILRKSGGTAVAVSETEIKKGIEQLARFEGIYASPEGGAAAVAVQKLIDSRNIDSKERVVILSTGPAYKYV